MRLQSAIFDMDGTLLDSMPTWRELGPTFLKETGISATPEQDRMLHTLADCDVIPYLREVCGLPWSQQEIIDQICPFILPLGLVGGCYSLLKKGKSGTAVMFGLLILGIVLVALGLV